METILLPVAQQNRLQLTLRSSATIDISSIPYDSWQILIQLVVLSNVEIFLFIDNQQYILAQGVYRLAIRRDEQGIRTIVYLTGSGGNNGSIGDFSVRIVIRPFEYIAAFDSGRCSVETSVFGTTVVQISGNLEAVATGCRAGAPSILNNVVTFRREEDTDELRLYADTSTFLASTREI